MPSLDTRSRLSRPFLALLAMLLVLPLSALLSAAPAQATAFTADGSVYDALGDPIESVTVEALASPTFSTAASSTTTDATGAYALAMTAGTYHLRFSKTGFGTAFYGGDVASTVVVAGDGSITVDGEPVIDNLLNDVTLASTSQHAVSGHVRNGDDVSLAGIDVAIFAVTDDVTPVDTATTDVSGDYEVQVPNGVYHVRYTDAGGTYLPTWYGGAEPQDVTVTGPLTLDPVTLATPPPASEYPIAGTVTDANGDPVAMVGVTVTGVGATTDSGTDNTTAEGGYNVVVLPGTYHVGFAKTGYVTTQYGGNATPSTITVANNGTLSVSGGEELIGNRLNDVTLDSTPFTVTGVVETTGDAGIPGITVRAFPEGSTDPGDIVDTDTSGAGGSYTLNLPIGSYDLEFADNDGAGTTYTTTALAQVKVAQGGALSVGGTPVAGLPHVQMSVSSVDTPHPVTGAVMDVNGTEVDGVIVSAVPQGATPGANATSDTTGADGGLGDHGRYRLMLKPGSYQLAVEGGADWADTTFVGGGVDTATVTVQLNGTVLVNGTEAVGGELDAVTLIGTTNYPITGTVTNGSTALAGLSVAVFTEGETSGDPLVTTTTSGTGGYAFNLPVGSYSLRYSGSSGGTLYTARWFGAGPAPGTSVQMGQGGVISVDGDPVSPLPDVVMTVAGVNDQHALPGDVVDNNYDGLPGVLVTAAAVGGGAVQDTDTSGIDGHFQLDLVPGSYQVKYEKSGYPLTWYPDPDTEGAHATIVVALDGTITIGGTPLTEGLDSQVLLNPAIKHPVSGTVVDELLAGLSGITVEALPEGDSTVAATTTSTTGGAYTLQVPVGTYTIRFTDNVVAAPTYAVTYLGGDSPSSVKVATGGQVSVDDTNVATLPAVTMTEVAEDVRYDLKGVIWNEFYDAPLDGVGVEVIPVATTPAANAETGTTGPDPVTGAGTLGDAGVYRIPTKPGKYQLRFTKTGYQTAYLTNYDDPTKPVTVTVAANGVISAPGLDIPNGAIDDVQLLLPAPVVVTAPKLTGKLVVGQVVTATPGTWSPSIPDLYPSWQDSTYVEWFLDGKSADQFGSGYYNQKFKVTSVAATKKLSFRISIDDPDAVHASAVFTSTPVTVPKAPSSLKGTYKAGKLTVTLTVPTLRKPTGKITVLKGTKKIGGGTIVAKNKGVIVITLAKLPKGKQKITIKYAGTATIAKCKKVVTIKV